MWIRKAAEIRSSEITPEKLYTDRREFLRVASTMLGASAIGTILPGCAEAAQSGQQPPLKKSKYDVVGEKLTPYEDVTGYNNYYEFGTGKEDPARNSKNFKPTPWT